MKRGLVLVPQRATVKAASEFASRNHLPHRIQDQMLSHICLRFKTEGLKAQMIFQRRFVQALHTICFFSCRAKGLPLPRSHMISFSSRFQIWKLSISHQRKSDTSEWVFHRILCACFGGSGSWEGSCSRCIWRGWSFLSYTTAFHSLHHRAFSDFKTQQNIVSECFTSKSRRHKL